MVKEYKRVATPLSGKGKLTEKVINSLQNFYEIAIRQNSSNLYEMKKAVCAILFHCRDMKEKEVHYQFCPKGESSWCNYQGDKITGDKKYKAHLNIPKWIHVSSNQFLLSYDLITCYQNVSMDVGEIQASLYIHNIICVKLPQNVFVEKQTLEIGVFSPVIEFNEDCQGIHKVIEYMGLETGLRLITKSRQRDSERVKRKMFKKCSEKGKKEEKNSDRSQKEHVFKEKELEPKDLILLVDIKKTLFFYTR